MASIEIKDIQGQTVGTLPLADSVFAQEPNIPVMHQVVRSQQAALRSGTHDTKTRGQVRGGGRKPFRQKGTGRARQGSIRSPQWRGGGTVFGPHPRSYAFKVNRKEVKLAMRSALAAKNREAVLHVVDDLEFEKPSTKAAVAALAALGLSGRVTIVLPDNSVNAFLSFRNIPTVRAIAVSESNTRDFLDNRSLVFTSASLRRIEEVLS